MSIQPHYPFPKRRQEVPDNKIFYIKSEIPDYISFTYEKNTSEKAVLIANQFFAIEDLLIESFKYVTPIFNNKNTISARFATVIRESCNLYELICKNAYADFFEYDKKNTLNIYNYLSLEYYLKINNEELRTAIFHNYLKDGERIKPFNSLSGWSFNSRLTNKHVPNWWTAYNKIKHDAENMIKYATFHNAIFSFAALFMIIRKIYGEGLICGFLREPTNEFKITAKLYPIKISEIFIGEIYKSRESK